MLARVHTDQEFILIKSLKSVPERGQDCLLYRVLQGVDPMEPRRAPLGGEGHSTEAHESFHGDDTTVGIHSVLDEQISPDINAECLRRSFKLFSFLWTVWHCVQILECALSVGLYHPGTP